MKSEVQLLPSPLPALTSGNTPVSACGISWAAIYRIKNLTWLPLLVMDVAPSLRTGPFGRRPAARTSLSEPSTTCFVGLASPTLTGQLSAGRSGAPRRGCAGRCAFGSPPHPDRARQARPAASTVEPRCGCGWAVSACLVGWSEPGNRPRAVTPGERPEDPPTGGDRHPARLGVRQGPPVHVLAQARRRPSVHPSDLRLALPGLPDPRPAVLQPRRPAVSGARHWAAGGGAGPAVAGQGDDEGRHRP